MKRLILVVLVVALLPATGWSTTYKLVGVVHEVNWSKCSSVVLDAVNPQDTYRTVWAKVGADATQTASGLPFSKAIALKINALAGSKLVRIALAGAAYYPMISAALEAYNAYKDWQYEADIPRVTGPGQGTVPIGAGTISAYVYVDQVGCSYGCDSPTAWPYTSGGWNYSRFRCTYKETGCYSGPLHRCYCMVPRVPLEYPAQRVTLDWGQVESALEADLAAGRPEGWALVKSVGQSHDQDLNASDADWPIDGPYSWPDVGSEHTAAEGEEIQTTYDDSVDQPTKDDLIASDPDDPSDPYGGWEDWEYSPEEIASAIDEKNRAILNDSSWSGHTESDPDPPDKDSITDKLTWFQSALEGLPLVNVLDSLQIEAMGADCNFCVGNTNMAGGDAGESCYSFCDVAGTVDAVGALLLALTCIYWTIYIFRSGG